METMFVIIGLILIGSVVLTNAASIFYFATQWFVDLCSALVGIFRLMRD